MSLEHAFTTLISAKSLAALLETTPRERLVLLDCRFDLGAADAGRKAYVTSHLPGARYADLNLDLSGPVSASSGRHPLPTPAAAAAFFAAAGIGAAGVGAATQVVAYDAANGAFAARAWWLLRWLGHTAVAVLDGGFAAWAAAGGALETAVVAPPPAQFRPQPGSQPVFTTAQVEAGLADGTQCIVDARAPERFAGSVEPLDTVAGHLPGALNHPFSANLGVDGRFLPPEELRRRWLARLGGVSPSSAILMCGSGVTACHNLLALEVAGLSGAALYAGSWSEWIRDPRRPVATGIAPDRA